MKLRWRRVVRFPIVALAAVLAIMMMPSVAGAIGVGLWHCSPLGDGVEYTCTTIKAAPSGGVQVYDYYDGEIYTLFNGNSVVIHYWHLDQSGLCGVNGNPYVWVIGWQNGGVHLAYIGDYYLNTGQVSNWNDYPDRGGHLGDNDHYAGPGSGTCDNFP